MSSTGNVVVIGGGPGGYVCAIRLAQLGASVTLVERDRVGGVCLNVGCIPSKALIHVAEGWRFATRHAAELGIVINNPCIDWPTTQAFRQKTVDALTGGVAKLLKGYGVTVLSGSACFLDPRRVKVDMAGGEQREVAFDHAIIATGSIPVELPGLPFSHPRIGHATEALSYPAIPRSLTVIGGGYIGLELGQAYASLGSAVTVIEMLPSILSGADPEAVRWVRRSLRDLGVEILTESKVERFTDAGDHLDLDVATPKGSRIVAAEQVLVSVGRRPSTEGLGCDAVGVTLDQRGFITVDEKFRTSQDGIYAIGDVIGPPYLAHRASAEGEVVAALIAGDERTHRPDPSLIPGVVFTVPEIAAVGLQEHEAEARGVAVKIGKFSYGGNGKALASQAGDGIVKLIADPATDRLLGAMIVGAHASSIIGGLAAAVRQGLTTTQVADTVHPHPSLGEIVMEAAKAVHGEAIHQLVKRAAR